MKKIPFLIIALLAAFSCSNARNLSAFFSVCTFNTPAQGPYVETYLDIVGNTVKMAKNANGKFQGKIEVELTVKKGDSTKYYDKYNVLSPESDDTTSCPNFIDQQRISLPNGEYNLTVKITDKMSAIHSFSAKQVVNVNYAADSVYVSDIELLQSYTKTKEQNKFTKSGYTIVPLVSDYYPQTLSSLKFYVEIYNTQSLLKEDPFVISYFISTENKYVMHTLTGYKRETPVAVCPLIAELSIKDLLTGNYFLTVEVRNKNNILLNSKQIFFQRYNPKSINQVASDLKSMNVENTFAERITNKDTLMDYIESVRPISSKLERDFADNELKIADIKYMQQFFYDFWLKRNSSDPEKEWKNYLVQVRKVNSAFGTRLYKGYETDRGRVYLEYGSPDVISRRENEPSAYPWEIWQYNKIGNQTNRRFLFYCREPATNLYVLLHSDAQGEVYNSRWQVDLYSRDTSYGNNFDIETVPENYGGGAVDEWKKLGGSVENINVKQPY